MNKKLLETVRHLVATLCIKLKLLFFSLLAQMKLFQEVQATELTKVRKDFHKLERDSKATLEKTESRAKKDLQAANTKVQFSKLWLYIFIVLQVKLN